MVSTFRMVTEPLKLERHEKLWIMKTEKITDKKFDAVKMMREIRDKIDIETEGMNFEELKKYYKKSADENRNRSAQKWFL